VSSFYFFKWFMVVIYLVVYIILVGNAKAVLFGN
jgi:hypothetical protein